MAIDPSIFAQANKPTVALADPQEQMRGLLGVQAQVNANKLYEAQRAAGAAAQGAIDPTTGQVDQNKLNRSLASDPSIAPAAMQALQQGNTIGGSQTDNQIKRRAAVQQSAIGLLTMSDAQLQGGQALHSHFDSELQSGLMDQATHDAALRAAPPLGSNAGQIRQYLRQIAVGSMGSVEALNAGIGNRTTMSNGQSDIPGITGGIAAPNGQAGVFSRTGSPTEIYPTRGALLQQQTGVDGQGRQTSQTMADRAGQQGQSGLTGPAGAGGSGKYPGLPPGLLPPGYNGRYTPGGAASGKAPGQAAAPVAGPGGTVVTGLAPGQAEEATASVAHLEAARQDANTYQSRVTPLLQAQAALAKNPTTGVASDTLNNIRQRFATIGGVAGLGSFRPLGGSAEQDAAYDEASKYMRQTANNASGANRSDQGQSESGKSNANTLISPLATKEILRMSLAQERMKQAQLLDFNQTGKLGSEYDRHQANSATNIDPRAFMADQQTVVERTAMLSKMSGDERVRYLKSLRLAIDHVGMELPSGRAAPATLQPAPATPTPPEPLSRRANRLLP